jgi:hypothetical protein
VFIMDCETFDILGRWEIDRGPQNLHYDFWWNLPPFGAVAPLVTDIDLSMDDRFLYVACWGTGEMRQYDVTDPRKPKLAGSVHIGGIARRTPHPNGKAEAVRRWSRLAVTASGSTGPIRSTRHGITSSIPWAYQALKSWPM